MSEGDADNIRWWGGCGGRPVILSFYGIDTERFHPGIDASPLRAELGLEDGCRCVGFVSRFSNRKADVGLAFLESLPSLAEHIPSIKGLIVGEGPEAQRLAEAVQRVNARTGRPIALMVGPRTDVERVFALCEVAICTANTALESLACGTPTLAAGRTGYFGPVTLSRFQAARALCFADHGRSPEPLSAGLFLRDLAPLLVDRRGAIGASSACADMISSEYSVARMAEDMEKIYRRMLRRDAKGT